MAQRKPTGKKVERKEQSAAQAALTSPYNTMIPLYEAAYVYVAHPTTRKLIHCSTSSDSFLALMKELFDLGIGPRLVREFGEFAAIDSRWSAVAARVEAHVNAATPAGNAEVTAEADGVTV
jgi:hypothetical protein